MGAQTRKTLADLGEFGLIRQLQERSRDTEDVILGSGDDAAVVRAPDGRIVISTDTLIEGVHFKGEWAPAAAIGRRAAAASLADIAAMGARTTALVVALAGPAEMSATWALDLAEGLAEEAGSVGAAVVGGDIARARQVMITVTAVGDLEGRDPVRRSGAKPGDVVAIAGRQGWAAAGLTVLSRGFRSPRALVEAYQHPEPPYDSGPAAALAGAHAMCDVSDGLLADARHIAEESGVQIDIDPTRIVVDKALSETSQAFNVDPMLWVLAGGDDHALLAVFPPEAQLPAGFTVIGDVRPRSEDGWVAVAGRPWSGETGHEHFL